MTRLREGIRKFSDLTSYNEHSSDCVQKAKEILGELANKFTEEELRNTITEIRYLTETWLDDFERQAFKGKTLKEILNEKGEP